jgi:hypothetical protein
MIHNGTILPIQLSSTISLAKAAPGQTISARIAQDVPLENGVLRRGTRISGHIVAVTVGNPSRIAFTFDKIEYSKSDSVSVETNLRVLASNLEIDSASTPTTGSDRGTPEVWWNTVQVGGEALYGSGPLMRGDQILGQWVAQGLSARLKLTESAVAKLLATLTSRLCGDSPRMLAAYMAIPIF